MEKYRVYIALGVMGVALWALVHTLHGKDAPSIGNFSEEHFLMGYAGIEPIKAIDGAVSWELFAEVGEVIREESDPDYPNSMTFWPEPRFTEAMRVLDGQTVRLMGYIFPLDASDAQSRFLFGPYPATCPYHYHVNNNQVVEVLADPPIPFSWDPVAIEGTLHLIEQDKEQGLFYRLDKAVLRKNY